MTNIGDARSLAIQPISTTHSQLSPQQLAGAGVSLNYIRLNGLEDIGDLLWDIDQ